MSATTPLPDVRLLMWPAIGLFPGLACWGPMAGGLSLQVVSTDHVVNISSAGARTYTYAVISAVNQVSPSLLALHGFASVLRCARTRTHTTQTTCSV